MTCVCVQGRRLEKARSKGIFYGYIGIKLNRTKSTFHSHTGCLALPQVFNSVSCSQKNTSTNLNESEIVTKKGKHEKTDE